MPKCPWSRVKEAAAYALIDGRDNLGYLVAHRCARIAIDKARQSGVGVVGGRETSHSGMLGYYASMIADAGLVGLVMCNTGPRIVPWGWAREPVLGTNPIAAGFPSAEGRVLVDFSCAAITNGEILVALKDGKAIPAGRALGPDGEPTTDPELARLGGALPFGEHKGYALGGDDSAFFRRVARCGCRARDGKELRDFHAGHRSVHFFGGWMRFVRAWARSCMQLKTRCQRTVSPRFWCQGNAHSGNERGGIQSGVAIDDAVMKALERLKSASGQPVTDLALTVRFALATLIARTRVYFTKTLEVVMLKGCHTALITPLTADHALDDDGLEQLVAFQIAERDRWRVGLWHHGGEPHP